MFPGASFFLAFHLKRGARSLEEVNARRNVTGILAPIYSKCFFPYPALRDFQLLGQEVRVLVKC